MEHWTRQIPFKVNMAGVIHIMGSALYSRPDAAIRELIQNGHDAILRRRMIAPRFQGRLDIIQLPDIYCIEFRDDGFGLSAEDAENYLGTLGLV